MFFHPSHTGKSLTVPKTNVFTTLVGSDLDHKIKAAAADGEEQWHGLGEKTGTKVWRIEQFKVKPWSESKYGKFHTGDTYIVLNSYIIDGEEELKHDIHIWIGSESSQDEYGTAAYKMVEADEYLGGSAVQYREVQSNESDLFKSYFNNRVTYLDGGAESGFNHVEPTKDTPHLYKVKGTSKAMSLQQVPVSKKSLSSGDSFILFANTALVWVWHGMNANPHEVSRAASLAENLCTEGNVTEMTQGQGDEEYAEFWAYLGDGTIAEDGDDDSDDAIEEFTPLLFQLGSGSPEQVAKGEATKVGFRDTQLQISRDVLDESNIYLLDSGWDIIVWIGKNSDRSEKTSALTKAEEYCKEDPRTADLPVQIIKSGFETETFNNYFK
jgi:gelsolin